jgi:hypothetical protein
LKQKRQELKDFMTRRIAYLIEEKENRSKLLNTRDPDVEATRTLEDSQNTKVPISNNEKVLISNPRKESQQRTVTMSKDDKNQNRKRNIEMKLTGRNARKLSNKKAKFEKLLKVPEGTSQVENLQNGSFVRISEQ